MNTENILELRNITKLYPGVKALDDVSISFRRGEIHALLGENGAGKSTLIKTITGAIRPTSGEIVYNGRFYTHFTPAQSLELGISAIYQELNLIPSLTVAENIFFGCEPRKGMFIDRATMNSRTKELLNDFDIHIEPTAALRSLSVAQQQIIEILKSMSKNLELVIMDEPTASLTQAETRIFFQLIRRLREKGVTIIFISHHLSELFEICDCVNEGFFLNNVPTKFKGVNLHADGGPMGHAIPESFWAYRLRQLKELGCNAIGLSHCPHAPEFLDLCDRMGFLVNSEYADKWEPPFYVDFYETWNEDLTGWMRRDRNHPSVVMWSLGCENNEPGVEYLDKRLEMFASRMREIDRTRPICSSLDRGHDIPGGRGRQIVDTCRSLDLIGVNYAEQWFDDMVEYAPDALFLGTESYMYFTSEHEERLTQTEMNPWLKVLEDDRFIGQFKWVGIDYLGEASLFWPKQGLSSGIFDMVGTKKPQAYLMESFWSDKPMVCAAIYRQNPNKFILNNILDQWECPVLDFDWRTDMPEADVATYTNCETVELWLNGRRLGEQRLSDIPNRIMKWHIPYEAGELTAIGKNDSQEAARFTIQTSGAPSALALTPDLKKMRADRAEITLVEIVLKDSNGVQCRNSDARVTITVEGSGTLERVGSGDLTNHESFFGSSVRLYQGKAVCFVRASDEPGIAVITARTGDGICARSEIQII